MIWISRQAIWLLLRLCLERMEELLSLLGILSSYWFIWMWVILAPTSSFEPTFIFLSMTQLCFRCALRLSNVQNFEFYKTEKLSELDENCQQLLSFVNNQSKCLFCLGILQERSNRETPTFRNFYLSVGPWYFHRFVGQNMAHIWKYSFLWALHNIYSGK